MPEEKKPAGTVVYTIEVVGDQRTEIARSATQADADKFRGEYLAANPAAVLEHDTRDEVY